MDGSEEVSEVDLEVSLEVSPEVNPEVNPNSSLLLTVRAKTRGFSARLVH